MNESLSASGGCICPKFVLIEFKINFLSIYTLNPKWVNPKKQHEPSLRGQGYTKTCNFVHNQIPMF